MGKLLLKIGSPVHDETMLSVVLYGRNDDHGYNYHKRLAISLNCLSELLTSPGDEIIFVDYNSSDELPTIIEAIQDTLTDKTKRVLRVFRVRSHYHAQVKTHLPVLEPLARNVAIRRSNPGNKWILFTNVDMILIPQSRDSLSEIVSSLEDGFYSLPRFEIPESLWELSLNRLDPKGNITFLKEAASRLHLDTIVRKEGFVQYDNPGDFQLVLRSDLFEIRGFDESMVLGWHVDSNLFKRLSLIRQNQRTIENEIKAYHCNHTYKESVLHSAERTENDWNRYVDNDMLQSVANGPDWGLANEQIEEISLGSNKHLSSIITLLEKFPKEKYEILLNSSMYNNTTYFPARIFSYLVDHLAYAPKAMDIVYFGHNLELSKMIESYCVMNGFSGTVINNPATNIDCSKALTIFDFGFDSSSPRGEKIKCLLEEYVACRVLLRTLMKKFFQIQKSLKAQSKVIGININFTHYQIIFSKHLSMRTTSYITGISYGYLPNKKMKRRSLSLRLLKKKLGFMRKYLQIRYFKK